MNRRGVTLPELLITLVIVGVVTIVITNAYLTAGTLTTKEEIGTRVGIEASRTLDTLDAILRQGKAILTQYPPEPAAATHVTDENTLVFTVPSLLVSNTLSATHDDTIVIDYNAAARRIDILTFPNAAAPSVRSSDTKIGAYEVKDMYVRLPSVNINSATSATVTVTAEKQSRGHTSTQTSILYGSFRNR